MKKTLYQHLCHQGATDVSQTACQALEAACQPGTVDVDALTAALNPFLSDPPTLSLAPSTQDRYPAGQYVMTQALLFCIEKYSLGDDRSKWRKALFFDVPEVMKLSQKRDCFLIRMMNARLKGAKKQTDDFRKRQGDVSATCALFVWQMENMQDNNELKQVALDELLRRLMQEGDACCKTEQGAIAWLYSKHIERSQVDRWEFFNTVYQRYRDHRFTMMTIDAFDGEMRAELNKVDDTYQKMERLTWYQSRGMMFGGFAFGIEVGVLVLEELALNETLEAWHVLVLSGALCMTLGRRLGLFFFRSHEHELDKQNKENYYRAQYEPPQAACWQPRSWTALVGTTGEGLLVFYGLLTSSLFLCDMLVWAGHRKDDYTSRIPGTYFWDKASEAGEGWAAMAYLVTGVFGVVAALSAWSLARGHYALDGKETEAYEAERKEREGLKMVR